MLWLDPMTPASAATSQISNAGPRLPSVGGVQLSVIVPTLNERDNIDLLVARLDVALGEIDWEVIFVDDDSKDGTIDAVRALAQTDRRVRGIRRIARRGLSGACLEGILASSALVVAVMDGDLQHDEKCLAPMFRILNQEEVDLVAATRYHGDGAAEAGLTKNRMHASRLATRLAQKVLRVPLSDPMSGFFMVRRDLVETVAPRLSRQGFKILLDIVASSPATLRFREIPFVFGPRLHGQSKLDASVVLEYLGLVIAKASGDRISSRFLAFGLVGTLGIVVHLTVLRMVLASGVQFSIAQTIAMLTAMTFNYSLNNELTYRDRRRTGWRFLTGLGLFAALCSFGVVAGVGVSTLFYEREPRWWIAGIAGAAIGAGWNYLTSSAITWRNQ